MPAAIHRLCIFLATTAITSASLSMSEGALAASQRSSWVTQNIYSYNHPYAAQLPQELATKMSKMSAGAFSFYRGTAHLFYEDMKSRASAFTNSATSKVWLEGDMHLQNFSAFKDAGGNKVFDVSDFDEGYWGPYTWDVWRMAVSIILAAKEQGMSSSDRDALVDNFVESYLDKMNDFSGNDDEKNYRLTSGNTNGEVKDAIQALDSKTRGALLSKYTSVVNGKRKFLATSELQALTSTSYSAIGAAMSGYISSIPSSKRYATSYYTLKDARLKLGSGTGSLGRYRYYLLIEGPTTSTSDDVILEMKQEVGSAVAIAAGSLMPSSVYGSNQGKRVALTMKAQLSNTDLLAGWTTVSGASYFLREKSPFQEDFDYTKLTSYSEWMDATGYFGKTLAKIHALSDKDYDSTLISSGVDKAISDITNGKHSEFRAEVRSFAKDYATQVEYDYQAFLSAYRAGQTLY
ncbi:MAG: DUF2252 domain-containing protein [Pseudomonadota bacterium]